MRIHWSDNDRYFGPFTFARERSYRRFGLVLGSGDGDDYPGCRLRMHAFGRTLIVALPPIIKPAREWVDTSRHSWSKGAGGYWDSHEREYGFVFVEGALHLDYGQQTGDSTTDKSKCYFLPWKQWRFVGHRLYGLDGKLFAKLPHRAKFNSPAYAEQKRLEDACPTASFDFDDFDGERITAVTKIEEREWAFGERKFKWLSLFRRNKIRRSLDIRFSAETGKRKGSWKGGTVGHGIDMLPGELHVDAFRRYCAEHNMSFVMPLVGA